MKLASNIIKCAKSVYLNNSKIMGDRLLDHHQLINGIAVLLSFFIGYKYALKRHGINKDLKETKCDNKEMVTNIRRSLFTPTKDYKMVIIVRNDLKMGRGKIASQCGHGAVGAYKKALKHIPHLVEAWEDSGCAKIALKVESEPELMGIMRVAMSNKLNVCLIRDAGRTQIEPNSATVLAIGPAEVEAIDVVTRHLKLL